MKKSMLVVCALVVGLYLSTLVSGHAGQIESLPGSVSRGEQVIREKGCLDCHALKGSGGKRAPDFAALSAGADTPVLLATSIWNHGPRMWAEFESAGRPIPSLSQNDVA